MNKINDIGNKISINRCGNHLSLTRAQLFKANDVVS